MNRRFYGKTYASEISSAHFTIETGEARWFRFRPQTAVDTPEGEDVDIGLAALSIEEAGDRLTCTWRARSNRWAEKEYRLTLTPDEFTYDVCVRGRGAVTRVEYFSGDRAARYPGSSYEAAEYEVPVMLANEKSPARTRTTAQDYKLKAEGFSPPMFAFAFRLAEGKDRLTLGLGALEGNCNFDNFAYRCACMPLDVSRCTFTSDYDGQHRVDGAWRTPPIAGFHTESADDGFERYARWHFERGAERPARSYPRWFCGPLFCGWKEQWLLHGQDGAAAAGERYYDIISDRLDARGLKPSALIIDDKWQGEYGAAMPDPVKWPNLRAFADRQHGKGRNVVLWFRCWSPEGLDADECVLDAQGNPLTADPTSPKYQARIRAAFRTLLSSEPGCFDCDGFKLDFMMCVPRGRGLRIHEPNVYGVALLKRMMELLYRAAKEAKADALVNASCGHPLFAGLSDQVRLHDCYFALRDSVRIMRDRAKLAQIALPGILIDTDAGACGSRRDFMDFARKCSEFGIPDLYFLSPIEDCALTDEDFEEIRQLWTRYSERIDAQFGAANAP